MFKKSIVAFILLVVILFIVAHFFSGTIPPDALTRTTMIGIARRVREYTKTHKYLPEDILTLPEQEGYSNSIKDGWGNKILYMITEDEMVILASFGKDRKPGGIGKNIDIIRSFAPKGETFAPFMEPFMSNSSVANVTRARMIAIAEEVRRYAKIHKELPTDILFLAKSALYGNITQDEWGHQIYYSINDCGVFTVSSLGKDGQPWGEGEASDTKMSFKVKLENHSKLEERGKVLKHQHVLYKEIAKKLEKIYDI